MGTGREFLFSERNSERKRLTRKGRKKGAGAEQWTSLNNHQPQEGEKSRDHIYRPHQQAPINKALLKLLNPAGKRNRHARKNFGSQLLKKQPKRGCNRIDLRPKFSALWAEFHRRQKPLANRPIPSFPIPEGCKER
jgi:hypothetical protein